MKITFPRTGGRAILRTMKFPSGPRWLLLGLAGANLAPAARAQEADVEILGASVSKEKTEVMLVQKSTGSGKWVQIGRSFAGYTAAAYDDQTGRLTLTKDRATHVIVLKKATVSAAPATPATPEQQKQILHNLRQLSAAADQYFLEQGVNKVEAAKLIGPAAYIRDLKPVAGETYAGMIIEQGRPLRIKTSGGFEMEYQP